MENSTSIKSIIQESFDYSNKIKRIEYILYSENIAKKVWHDIFKLKIGTEPVYSEFKRWLYLELIKWIHGDKTCKFDLLKSFYFAGNTGSGKTKTFEVINDYMLIDNVKYVKNNKFVKLNFHIVNSRKIVSDYANFGYIGIEKYSSYLNLCIDDLGNEVKEIKHFGSSLNCIEEIIENRYYKNLMTHISSNLPIELIGEIYSDRIYSRLKEMCNYVVINNEDLRLLNNK